MDIGKNEYSGNDFLPDAKRKEGLLEKLQNELSCMFLSDLRYGKVNDMAKKMLRETDLTAFTLSELEDAAIYVYGGRISFESFEEANAFFQK